MEEVPWGWYRLHQERLQRRAGEACRWTGSWSSNWQGCRRNCCSLLCAAVWMASPYIAHPDISVPRLCRTTSTAQATQFHCQSHPIERVQSTETRFSQCASQGQRSLSPIITPNKVIAGSMWPLQARQVSEVDTATVELCAQRLAGTLDVHTARSCRPAQMAALVGHSNIFMACSTWATRRVIATPKHASQSPTNNTQHQQRSSRHKHREERASYEQTEGNSDRTVCAL